MFNTYEFTFADTPASMYGLFVCDFGDKRHGENSFANSANIVETRLPRRITPLHYGVRYNDSPLKFNLIFGSENEMDRYQLQEVTNWLTGYQDYQWLSIDQPDMDNIQFRCLIQSITPITVVWAPFAFEASIVCDCPYGYSFPFESTITISGDTKHRFYNDSTVREKLLPTLQVELNSDTKNFSITNEETGETMEFTNLPSGGVKMRIDNENGIIQCLNGEYNLYEYFNFKFFSLVSGDNNLTLRGNGKVTISGRYLYNVGA